MAQSPGLGSRFQPQSRLLTHSSYSMVENPLRSCEEGGSKHISPSCSPAPPRLGEGEKVQPLLGQLRRVGRGDQREQVGVACVKRQEGPPQTGPGLNSRAEQICCYCDARTLPDQFSSLHPAATTHFQFDVGGATPPSLSTPAVCHRLPLPGRCCQRRLAAHHQGSAEEISWPGAQPSPSSPRLGKGVLCTVQGIQAISKFS